jgi:predicted nucleic acid-binding protein
VIVVDASAAILGLLHDGHAREILARETLTCPHLTDAEVAHAMRAQVAKGVVDSDTAGRALAVWAQLGIERFPVIGFLQRIWELRDNVTAYDATYVALAESLGCALLTADARLARAQGAKCPITVVKT